MAKNKKNPAPDTIPGSAGSPAPEDTSATHSQAEMDAALKEAEKSQKARDAERTKAQRELDAAAQKSQRAAEQEWASKFDRTK